MTTLAKWLARGGALLLSTVTLAVLVPVSAWASSGTGAVVTDLAQRRRGVLGGLTWLCCLAVVLAIVGLVVLLLTRRSRPPRS
jgi:hypothetical protein